MTGHRYMISVHPTPSSRPLPAEIAVIADLGHFVALRIDEVTFHLPDLAAVCDLLERLRIEADARLLDQQGRPHLPGWAPDELAAQGAALADEIDAAAANVSRRLRTMRYREQIAELTAEEAEAEARGERLADAIAAEDGAA